jgi:hypothetical protein
MNNRAAGGATESRPARGSVDEAHSCCCVQRYATCKLRWDAIRPLHVKQQARTNFSSLFTANAGAHYELRDDNQDDEGKLESPNACGVPITPRQKAAAAASFKAQGVPNQPSDPRPLRQHQCVGRRVARISTTKRSKPMMPMAQRKNMARSASLHRNMRAILLPNPLRPSLRVHALLQRSRARSAYKTSTAMW